MSIILVVSLMLAASPSSQKITEKCIDTSGMRTPGVLSLIEHPVRDGKDTIDVFDTQKRVIARIYSSPSDGFVIAFVLGNHRSLTILHCFAPFLPSVRVTSISLRQRRSF